MTEKKILKKPSRHVRNSSSKDKLSILSLRNIVVFPEMMVPLFVGRRRSVSAVNWAKENEKPLLLVTQKEPSVDDPEGKDLYTTGCVGNLKQVLTLPDGTLKILVQGQKRVFINKIDEDEGRLTATFSPFSSELPLKDASSLRQILINELETYLDLARKQSTERLRDLKKIEELSHLIDAIATHAHFKVEQKQEILSLPSLEKRADTLINALVMENEMLRAQKRIRKRVQEQLTEEQRQHLLYQHIKAMQQELGEIDDSRDELTALEARLKKKKFSTEVQARAQTELKKLRTMNPLSAEASVVRGYLEWLEELPTSADRSRLSKDLARPQKILDEGHYGLEKVKERIIEYLAVQSRVGKTRGSIMCFLGPPGVGKTSLGKSIAEATGRKFVRVSLGGVRDEAEILGHRRTYVGAMPGKFIQALRKAKTSNPLILVDEIDKTSSDHWRGDVQGALLSFFDPEQNTNVVDHYMEVGWDFSEALFILTANSLDSLSRPLRDRLEIIDLPSYTENEKVRIAERYLIPRQKKNHGVKEEEFSISSEAIRQLIRQYTREAGVRQLQREISGLMRKTVVAISLKKEGPLNITKTNLHRYAGIPKFLRLPRLENNTIGVATGLAWTQVGGEILFIEALRLSGKGKVRATGKLGEVMQESVQAAASFVHAHLERYGLDPKIFEKFDVHIHIPEGATPKDGPSAGIAIFTALLSTLSGISVLSDVAMTGEISFRGGVLAVGGLKEKLLAAHRSGIKKVLIPKDNEKDLSEIPKPVLKDITVIPVSHMDEVIAHALAAPLKHMTWTTPPADFKSSDLEFSSTRKLSSFEKSQSSNRH